MSKEPQSNFDEAALSASADAALAALNRAGNDASRLLEQWIARGNAGAVQEAALHGSGPLRKLARRGLNVLGSRGVPIPATHRRTKLLSDEVKPAEAWLLSPDATGVRLLAFSKPQRGGSCQACLIFIRDGQGLFQVENMSCTLGQFKAALAKVLPGAGYDAVKVPLEWARAKVAQARALHAERKLPEPLGLGPARELLEPSPAAEPTHPFDEEGFEFSDEDAKDLAKDSGRLHHLPEFRAWLPSQQSVRQMLQDVGRSLPSDAPPEQERVSEQLKAEMLSATDRYFTPEARAELVRWMKDAGLSVLGREGESVALEVAATIQVIEKCGLVTDPPQAVPFLRAFFEKAVSVLMAQSGGKLEIPIPRAS